MKKFNNIQEAEAIAIEALAFIAQNGELLDRFLALTGISSGDIRAAATSPGFLAGVLSFMLNHEPTLFEFCEAANKPPEQIAQAFALLPGGDKIEH